MHTYIKNTDGTYTIGMWLPHQVGDSAFWRLFDVAKIDHALAAVNTLNGGELNPTFYIFITKEH